MARKLRNAGPRRKRRSAAQREWAAAVGAASAAWKDLSVLELRSWNTQGKARRTSGQRYHVMCNARRIRDGQRPLKLPPADTTCDWNGKLKRVVIINRRGGIKIQVELRGVPTAPITVWASRPFDQWVSACYKVPRLGPLPPPVGVLSDITALYVKKHGWPAPGKWFRLFLRQEQGNAALPCGNADVTVPERQGARGRAKKW